MDERAKCVDLEKYIDTRIEHMQREIDKGERDVSEKQQRLDAKLLEMNHLRAEMATTRAEFVSMQLWREQHETLVKEIDSLKGYRSWVTGALAGLGCITIVLAIFVWLTHK